jgi:ABC-type oligopeptide transport system ATPase subunit
VRRSAGSKGETLGLVGESGSGKTTVRRCILQLERPTAGEVYYQGREVSKLRKRDLRSLRREMQIIFQDPYSSVNPRMTAGRIVGDPLVVHGLVKTRDEPHERIAELFQLVGLAPYLAIVTPTSSAEANASASESRGPSQSSPNASSRTRLYRPWTCRSRPKSST